MTTCPSPLPPAVGAVSTAAPGTCAFGPRPGDPLCDQPATWHLLVNASPPGYEPGPVNLSSCDRHVRIARASGQLIGEHAYRPLCSDPEARWSEQTNTCAMPPASIPVQPHWGDDR